MRNRTTGLVVLALLFSLVAAVPAAADHPDDGVNDGSQDHLEVPDLSAALEAHDAATEGIVSTGPSAKVTKNLDLRGRGTRNDATATTDVWAHAGYAYTGTFNSPCGGDPEAGIWVWDVSNKNQADFVTIIQSPTGSRSNDVKVAGMNSGDILVHSNEACTAGGPGGFEIYNVDDPENPELLASVRMDELQEIVPFFFAPGSLENVGSHNLFLFTQGPKDYVAAQAESILDGFRIFDITDPSSPSLVTAWGAEEVFDPGVGDLTLVDDPAGARTLDSVLWMLGLAPFSGFGASQNRLLHDFTISADGTKAYLAHWDAGLILLDIADPSNPQVVSVALDPVNGSLDGEVNSHAVWPSADGSIVVEGEEDFSVFEDLVVPTNLSMQFLNSIPGVAVSTSAGDAFEANQPGNAGTVEEDLVTVTSGPLAGQTFPADEFVNNNAPLGDGAVSGNFVWVGRACNGDPLENPLSPGDIAVARRGACFFSDKEANVAAAGAAAIVIANNLDPSVWSGLRIWDYSDPENPILASTFNTVCSADPYATICDPAGTYSAHNVVVEDRGSRVMAYISWYSDGMLILDVTDPYNPVEVGRFLDDSTNDGEPNDFWGVYKERNEPFLYGSDRNGGLYIFKEQGSGSK